MCSSYKATPSNTNINGSIFLLLAKMPQITIFVVVADFTQKITSKTSLPSCKNYALKSAVHNTFNGMFQWISKHSKCCIIKKPQNFLNMTRVAHGWYFNLSTSTLYLIKVTLQMKSELYKYINLSTFPVAHAVLWCMNNHNRLLTNFRISISGPFTCIVVTPQVCPISHWIGWPVTTVVRLLVLCCWLLAGPLAVTSCAAGRLPQGVIYLGQEELLVCTKL